MRPVLVLSFICMIAAALLAGVNQLTMGPIVEAEKQLKMDALDEIFPFEIKKVTVCEKNGTV
ncbi:MAG: hypothetical protein U9N38_05860 [Thermodesulfobacteriota bacterium]|nr:hypothetical protein [Thermodesulfobacteriota bacterium]